MTVCYERRATDMLSAINRSNSVLRAPAGRLRASARTGRCQSAQCAKARGYAATASPAPSTGSASTS
eukprot:scaffold46411_cov45-Prasinocladus_malaysianus.AAC.2